ncbi:MAG: glycosyltransferase family 4 protein [Roseiflexus sp.]|jgi:glycosyltransferase involved in cell wall biosynthesis|nr:glycosyltransferase family 4 protein [Chloroflexus sp.]MBO9335492.1 glycosyltransferase family 4 protein [Roseiflexus sp.]MBO9383167.1 glycosyltransferase family 4 protein [Roseiflexus sp.]
MRVVMFSHTYLPAHYRGKLRWLSTEGGVNLTLVALPALRLSTGVRLIFEQKQEPFVVRFLQPLAFANHNILRFYAPHSVAALLRDVRPDIVHAEAEPHSLILGLLAFLKRFFSYRLVAFTWENLFRRGRGPLRWVERFALRRVDWMIGGNQEATEVVRWRGYKGPVTVIPQVGVDPAQFADPHSDKPDAADDSFRIGFAGRLVPEKGVLDLWEAFLPLANRAVLVLLGEGLLRDTILQQAATAGITHRVEMPGYVPYAQMPAWLKSLDVLVLPSRTTTIWKEQFGHVLVEAMLAGVPVIGSNSGAIPEVIGKAGLLFPEGDVPALRERLVFLAEHPEERRRLADTGTQRALQHFTDAAIARATLRVYEQVMEGK